MHWTKQTKHFLIILIGILALLGLSDASYLTLKHYSGEPITCSLTEGCEKVTSSKWSTLGGIPISLFGAIYYGLVFFLTIAYIDYKDKPILEAIFLLSTGAFLTSLGLVYLQLFVIESLCLYCMLSAVTSTGIFGLSYLAIKKHA